MPIRPRTLSVSLKISLMVTDYQGKAEQRQQGDGQGNFQGHTQCAGADGHGNTPVSRADQGSAETVPVRRSEKNQVMD